MTRAPYPGVAAILAALVSFAPVQAQTIQEIDPAQLPRFEVASVKPGDPNAYTRGMGTMPGRWFQHDINLLNAVAFAFNLRLYQLKRPLPELIDRDVFTIEARLPAGARAIDVPLMVRALLVDRFKLRYHVEHDRTDGYALTLARRDGRLGPRLRRTDVDCTARRAAMAQKKAVAPLPAGAECGVHNAPGVLAFGGMPFDTLVAMLSNKSDGPVVDQTGLTGNFDVELHFAERSNGPPPATASPSADDAPSIFTAVEEQLGLKLIPTKAPMDRLVIDHIERPDPD